MAKTPEETKIASDALHYENVFERDVDFRHRIIRITGDIEAPLFDYIDAAMTEMEKSSRKGITIKIHSEGGSVFEALAVVGRLKASSCFITTEGFGGIQSAATLILACGDKRKISSYAWFMHHEAWYSIEGRHESNKKAVLQIEREEEQWCKFMEQFSDRDATFWREIGKHVDAYFNPQELLDAGVVDEIF
jgi:ATP-dependent protease ClpP protease subunit